ncbi:unnamed protein product [Coregonus sp. 'balchen']|nr:unnamed protein product [Coregonus sp. 'balchen']
MTNLIVFILSLSTCLSVVSGRHPTCNFLLELETDQEECLVKLRDQEPSNYSKGVGCKAIWDNIACWDRAEVGETVTRECPRVLKMFFGRNGNISKNCTADGWSDVFPNITSVCGAEEKHDKLRSTLTYALESQFTALLYGGEDVIYAGPQFVFDRPHNWERHPLSIQVRVRVSPK